MNCKHIYFQGGNVILRCLGGVLTLGLCETNDPNSHDTLK